MDEHDGRQTQITGGPVEPTLAQEVQTANVLFASGRRRRRGLAFLAGGAALAVGLLAGGVAWSEGSGTAAASTESASSGVAAGSSAVDEGSGTTALGGPPTGWSGPGGGQGAGSPGGTGAGTAGTAVDSTAATTAQQVGLVTIVTTLGYEDASAAGTGIVLTADGVILTNNHVIEGATTVVVTVESTGEAYTAQVVGTDATDDVAVLQLEDAPGLATAAIDDDGVVVGQAVAAVGNSDGGGELLAAAGTVTSLAETITTQSEGATAGRTLTDLIEIDADVVAGDSGGAVLDAEGEVVGMTTAASSGSAAIAGYAIAIDDALDAVAQIQAGVASGVDTETITVGYPGFLGVQIGAATTGPAATGSTGALVGGVFAGTPAADAGLVAGDTITALGGVAVDSADALSALVAGYDPGDQVELTWTSSATGMTSTVTVTLIAGPAD